jgi:hypothetical protein
MVGSLLGWALEVHTYNMLSVVLLVLPPDVNHSWGEDQKKVWV